MDNPDFCRQRLTDTPHHAIREAVRRRGGGSRLKILQSQKSESYWCSCDICARVKMHQNSFPAVRNRLNGLSLVLVCLQLCLSCRTYRLVRAFITDHSTKMCWVFQLKTSPNTSWLSLHRSIEAGAVIVSDHHGSKMIVCRREQWTHLDCARGASRRSMPAIRRWQVRGSVRTGRQVDRWRLCALAACC